MRKGLLGGETAKEQYVPKINSYSSVCSGKLAGHHKPKGVEYISLCTSV